MIEICFCFQCGGSSSAESVTVIDTDRSPKMPSHCRWFNSLWTVRGGRPFKSLCFLTVSLAFCFGLGIGLFISLYVLPLSTQDPFGHNPLPSNQFLYSQLEVSVPIPTNSDNQNIPIVVESEPMKTRFPEFAQIEALHRESQLDSSKHPILRRPNSNVQFLPPMNRILALHPSPLRESMLKFTTSIPSLLHGIDERSDSSIVEKNVVDLLDGIYWSENVEATLPKGFTNSEVDSWRQFVQNSSVVKVEEGCGRMQNRLLTLENGRRACGRYRQNSDQIQGEIFSFYLSQLLGIQNLAPSALNLVQGQTPQWSPVQHELSLAQWADEKPVVLTQFLPNLIPVTIPSPFRDSKPSLQPGDVLNPTTGSQDIKQLAQWSDLIVFDYLTANLDRVVNNLFNLQWNPSMMDAPAHNLAQDSVTGLLVFLDNESGLLHGYRLLDKYEPFHRLMLDSLCVFRRSTATALERLYRDKNTGKILKKMFQEFEPQLYHYLPSLPEKSVKILNHRVQVVYDQIKKCESLYMP